MLEIGNTLRDIRSRKNLSLSALSKRSGVSRSYISKIEQNQQSPSIEYLEKLCEGLDIPFSIFIFLADNKESKNSLDSIVQNMKKIIYEQFL